MRIRTGGGEKKRTSLASVYLGILQRSTRLDVLVVAQLVFGVLDEVPDVVERWVPVGAVAPEGVLSNGAAFGLANSTYYNQIIGQLTP